MDLALNNLQRLICHKTQQTKPNQLLVEEMKLASWVQNQYKTDSILLYIDAFRKSMNPFVIPPTTDK